MLVVLDQRSAEVSAPPGTQSLPSRCSRRLTGEAQWRKHHAAAVRQRERARIVGGGIGRARIDQRDGAACDVALRRASQPASASPTGPAPTMAMS